MSSSILLERGAVTSPGYSNPVTLPQLANLPSSGNWCAVPRCEVKFEKCSGGIRIVCTCDDEVSCGALQNLCRMLAGGVCNCCVTWNGMTICQCNLALGNCHCEFTADGVCITCVTGDRNCCEMLQACCDCLTACCKPGCCCYVSFNNTPVGCCCC